MLVGVDAELLGDVHLQRQLGVGVHLPGHGLGGLLREPHLAVHVDELRLLGLRVPGQLGSLDGDLARHRVVLRLHRRELAQRHREGAGNQAGHAGQDDHVPVGAAAADARDQGDVRDEPVHGAEGGGPQRAAGDVAVRVVALVLGELGRARKLGHGGSLCRTSAPHRRPDVLWHAGTRTCEVAGVGSRVATGAARLRT